MDLLTIQFYHKSSFKKLNISMIRMTKCKSDKNFKNKKLLRRFYFPPYATLSQSLCLESS